MKLSRQNKIVVGVVALVLALTVGYALFSQSLNIGGTASADGTFELVFDSIGTIVEKGSTGAEATNSQDKKTLTITVPNLEYPGAYVQIPAVIKNTGTVDAKLLGITTEGLSNDDMEVTYTGLEQNDIINSEEVRDIVITIKWKESSVTTSSSLSFNIGLNYEQVKVGDITIGSGESSFPVVEGQLGDNVYFKYDNGVINITGSGDMWETIPDTDGMCKKYLDVNCTLGTEIAKGVARKLNLSENVSVKFPMILSMFMLGKTFEDMGVTKDDLRQILMASGSDGGLGLTEEEANEAMVVIDNIPTFKNITIQNGITSMSKFLFFMSNMDHLSIPNTITTIGYSLFDSAKIETLKLEKGTTTVFANLTSGENPSIINNIMLPDSIITIQNNSINCAGLTTLTIPQSVTTIEAYAIRGDDLTTIVNTTGRAFDWNLILTGTSGEAFVTGTVEYDGRTITITEQ